MKKSLLALAALSAFASVASAQSSVTLFGIVDLAGTYSDNGGAKAVTSLSQDGLNSSRLGFRGVEDLGGGLRAGFWLEGAVGADTGCGGSGTLGSPVTVATTSTTVNQGTGAPVTQPPTTPLGTAASAQTVSTTPAAQTCIGQNWQRRSTVSLLGNFGEVRLGRDYTPTFWNLTVFDPFGTNGVASSLNMLSTLGSGATTAVRANNSVGYFLPALFGGLYGQAMVAAGEGVTGSSNTSTGNKYYGGRIGYAAGPINVAVAYGVTDKTGAMTDEYTNVNVGASYNFGFLTVQGYFGKYDYLDRTQKQGLIGLLVPLGSGTLRGSYVRTRGDLGVVSTSSDTYTAGYVYDLSKRTAIYATYAYLDNKGSNATGARFSVGYGSNSADFLPGNTSKGGQLGVRHSF